MTKLLAEDAAEKAKAQGPSKRGESVHRCSGSLGAWWLRLYTGSVSERAAHHAREEASRVVVVVVCTRAAVGWNLDARQKKDARQHLLHAAGQTQFSSFEGITHACNML